jgi:AcrR family transcriptional regulator
MTTIGRPRSTRADRAIIDAVLEEVIAVGIDGVSIEQVAARAGVAKGTVYRRWPNKGALVLDALGGLAESLPTLAGESVRADMIELVDGIRRRVIGSTAARLWPCMIGEAGRHPEIAAKYRNLVVEHHRELGREVVRRGIRTGELRSDVDVDVMLALFAGPMLAQIYLWSPGVEPPEDLAAKFVDAALTGLRPP